MIVYLAAAMRSGSTHIARGLCELLDYRVTTPRFGFAGRASTDDHQIDHNAQAAFHMDGRYVFHIHTKAFGNNLHLMKQGGYKPIVIQRNIFDSMVSVYDQMPANPYMTVPGVTRPEWDDMNPNEQWAWIAYNVAPWYQQFYASWHYADIDKHFVWYDEYFADQVKGMQGILRHIERGFSDDKIKAVVEKKDQSFHVGRKGRGKSIPTSIQGIVLDQIRAWGPLAERMRNDLA